MFSVLNRSLQFCETLFFFFFFLKKQAEATHRDGRSGVDGSVGSLYCTAGTNTTLLVTRNLRKSS